MKIKIWIVVGIIVFLVFPLFGCADDMDIRIPSSKLLEPNKDGIYKLKHATIKFIPPKGWNRLEIQCLTQLLRDRAGTHEPGLGQHHHELIATQTRDPINSVTQAPGATGHECLQHLVGRVVTEGLIDSPEAVEIATEDGERMRITPRAIQLARQVPQQIAAVVRAGQRVRLRQP